MKLILDTDTCIDLIRGRPLEVRATFAALRGSEPAAVSSITLMELEYGAAKSAPDHRTANCARLASFLSGPIEILAYDEADATSTGIVRAQLERLGAEIGAYDVMIAGQAFRRSLRVITSNTRHFGRVDGLLVESWRSP
jgi:tRNA(fMet)-specific endonuclease VapC